MFLPKKKNLVQRVAISGVAFFESRKESERMGSGFFRKMQGYVP
jgi:hypothetical protein